LIKVHLGCWHRHIPGFVHVDLCDMPHIDHKAGIDRLPFFADNSADLIYCSHALEYFDRDDARRVLAEWWRVLGPGGVLRLAVPDLQALIEIYHKTVYDEASLGALLQECGFSEPRRWDWRKTEHTSIDDHSQAYFPHMQKDTGTLVSLNIEATKPK
jgi:ubiquinone/menaquinone biosynthesis C-methylase UbiE